MKRTVFCATQNDTRTREGASVNKPWGTGPVWTNLFQRHHGAPRCHHRNASLVRSNELLHAGSRDIGVLTRKPCTVHSTRRSVHKQVMFLLLMYAVPRTAGAPLARKNLSTAASLAPSQRIHDDIAIAAAAVSERKAATANVVTGGLRVGAREKDSELTACEKC
jgi:hypothetical protein